MILIPQHSDNSFKTRERIVGASLMYLHCLCTGWSLATVRHCQQIFIKLFTTSIKCCSDSSVIYSIWFDSFCQAWWTCASSWRPRLCSWTWKRTTSLRSWRCCWRTWWTTTWWPTTSVETSWMLSFKTIHTSLRGSERWAKKTLDRKSNHFSFHQSKSSKSLGQKESVGSETGILVSRLSEFGWVCTQNIYVMVTTIL